MGAKRSNKPLNAFSALFVVEVKSNWKQETITTTTTTTFIYLSLHTGWDSLPRK